jgi:hypothetical protein
MSNFKQIVENAVRWFKRATGWGYHEYPPPNVKIADDRHEDQIRKFKSTRCAIQHEMQIFEQELKKIVNRDNRSHHNGN